MGPSTVIFLLVSIAAVTANYFTYDRPVRPGEGHRAALHDAVDLIAENKNLIKDTINNGLIADALTEALENGENLRSAPIYDPVIPALVVDAILKAGDNPTEETTRGIFDSLLGAIKRGGKRMKESVVRKLDRLFKKKPKYQALPAPEDDSGSSGGETETEELPDEQTRIADSDIVPALGLLNALADASDHALTEKTRGFIGKLGGLAIKLIKNAVRGKKKTKPNKRRCKRGRKGRKCRKGVRLPDPGPHPQPYPRPRPRPDPLPTLPPPVIEEPIEEPAEYPVGAGAGPEEMEQPVEEGPEEGVGEGAGPEEQVRMIHKAHRIYKKLQRYNYVNK